MPVLPKFPGSGFEWLLFIIPSLSWKEVTKTIHGQINKDGSKCISYRLRSLCHPDLKPIYEDFYNIIDNKLIKHIPSNLILTPIMLRHWFLGDGTAGDFSSGLDKNGNQKLSWQMTIYTCSFSREELESIILPQLADMGIIATVTMKPGRHRVRISSKSFKRFYEVIDSCPVDCYKYKWMPEEISNKFSIDNEKTYSKEINLSFEDLLDEGPDSFIQTNSSKKLYNYFREEIGSRYWTIKDQNKMKIKLRNFAKERNASLKHTTMVFNYQVEQANNIFKDNTRVTCPLDLGLLGKSEYDVKADNPEYGRPCNKNNECLLQKIVLIKE